MENLLDKVGNIVDKFDEIDLLSGSRFNIFSVLKITSDEVKLHSRFLAELLNPLGSHGQGDTFLKFFVQEVGLEEFDCESSIVEVEKYIGAKADDEGGRIDIYIVDRKGNAITIENKIYAGDQENQLLRYYNYNNKNVFYLDLYGDAPSEKSIGNLLIDEDFKVISYRVHILSWLEKCRKEAVELPLLREGITHYINAIKNLVGQSKSKTMEKEIRDLILSSGTNLKNAVQIKKTLTKAKIDIQWKFWVNLKNALEADVELKLMSVKDLDVTWQNVRSYYEDRRNRDIYFGLWYKIYDKDGLSIHFGIEVGDEIGYGFTLEKDKKGAISDLPEYSAYRELASQIHPSYTHNKWWIGKKSSIVSLNFRDFDSDEVYQLADKEGMNKTVSSISSEVVSHIKQMKQLLADYYQTVQ